MNDAPWLLPPRPPNNVRSPPRGPHVPRADRFVYAHDDEAVKKRVDNAIRVSEGHYNHLPEDVWQSLNLYLSRRSRHKSFKDFWSWEKKDDNQTFYDRLDEESQKTLLMDSQTHGDTQGPKGTGIHFSNPYLIGLEPRRLQ